MDKSMLERYPKYKCCVFIDFEYINQTKSDNCMYTLGTRVTRARNGKNGRADFKKCDTGKGKNSIT